MGGVAHGVTLYMGRVVLTKNGVSWIWGEFSAHRFNLIILKKIDQYRNTGQYCDTPCIFIVCHLVIYNTSININFMLK